MNKLLCKVCGKESDIINIINKGECSCGSKALTISVHNVNDNINQTTKKEESSDESI